MEGANPNHRGPADTRVGLASPTWQLVAPPLRRVSSRVFLIPLVSSFCHDKFHGRLVLKSLFSALSKIIPGKHKI